MVLTTPDHARGERDHLWPQFLPGSQAVLFTITSTHQRHGRVAGGGARPANRHAGRCSYPAAARRTTRQAATWCTPPQARCWRWPSMSGRLEVLGTPTPVLPQVMTLRSGTAEFDIARDGTLVYVPAGPASPTRTLVWVDRQGREEPVKGAPARAYTVPAPVTGWRAARLDSPRSGERYLGVGLRSRNSQAR